MTKVMTSLFSIVKLSIISINIPALLHYQSIYVTNDHGYVPDTCLIHDLSPGLVTRVTPTAPHVEQELLPIPRHLSFSRQWRSTCSIFAYLCSVLQLIFVLLSFFVCALHCLSVTDLQLLILLMVSSNCSQYIDILLELNKERGLKTKLYHKRDDNFSDSQLPFHQLQYPNSISVRSLYLTTHTNFWIELSCWCKLH